MKIRVTAIYEIDEDLETWPLGERSFTAIKEYYETDPSYWIEDKPKSVTIERIS